MKSSGDTQPQEADKAVLTLRVVLSLKNRLAVYARNRGLTLNAAAVTLLDRALSDDEH
jgi:hypothetical protein